MHPEGRARAIWLTGPRRVQIREELVAEPGPGEVLVATAASAISQGTELLVYRGEVAPSLALDLPTLRGSFGFPIKYGYAAVGHVLEVGSGVTSLAVGDPVVALHPHQTRFTVPSGLVWPIPSDVPVERATFVPNLETALNALLDQPVRVGERVVVFGLGVVGLLIGVLAARNGAGRVIGIDPLAFRRRLAHEMGFDLTAPPGPELLTWLRDETGGHGADLVFEASGSPAALQQAIEIVAPNATVVVCSWYGSKPVSLDLGGRFHRGRIRLHSSQVGQVDPSLAPRWDRDRRIAVVLGLLRHARLERLITHRVPFERAADAYRLVDGRQEPTGQVVLSYGSP